MSAHRPVSLLVACPQPSERSNLPPVQLWRAGAEQRFDRTPAKLATHDVEFPDFLSEGRRSTGPASRRTTRSSTVSMASSASNVPISTGSPGSTTPDQRSTPGECTTSTSGHVDHRAENHLPCLPRKLPARFKLPHRSWSTFSGTVKGVWHSSRRGLKEHFCFARLFSSRPGIAQNATTLTLVLSRS